MADSPANRTLLPVAPTGVAIRQRSAGLAIEAASFINASEQFEKGKRQNRLLDEHIEKIVSTYQFRKEEQRYSRRVPMELIEEEDFNLAVH